MPVSTNLVEVMEEPLASQWRGKRINWRTKQKIRHSKRLEFRGLEPDAMVKIFRLIGSMNGALESVQHSWCQGYIHIEVADSRIEFTGKVTIFGGVGQVFKVALSTAATIAEELQPLLPSGARIVFELDQTSVFSW